VNSELLIHEEPCEVAGKFEHYTSLEMSNLTTTEEGIHDSKRLTIDIHRCGPTSNLANKQSHESIGSYNDALARLNINRLGSRCNASRLIILLSLTD